MARKRLPIPVQMAVQIFGAVNQGKILAAQGLSALKTVGGGGYRVRTLDNGKEGVPAA